MCYTGVNVIQTDGAESEWQSTQQESKSQRLLALRYFNATTRKTLGTVSGRRWNTCGFCGAVEDTQPGGGQCVCVCVGDLKALKEMKNLNGWQTRQRENVPAHFKWPCFFSPHSFLNGTTLAQKQQQKAYKSCGGAALMCYVEGFSWYSFAGRLCRLVRGRILAQQDGRILAQQDVYSIFILQPAFRH